MLRRLLPIVVLLTIVVVFFASGAHQWLTLERLAAHKNLLQAKVAAAPLLSVLVFALAYIVMVAASLPGATLFSLAAGFLFGQWLGTLLVIGGATIGAVLLFFLVHTAFGESLRVRVGPWFQKISTGFQDNAISYMLFLRLVPLFPFFAVNIAGAMLGVRASVFTLTTVVGIAPGSFVFVSAGVGLDSVLETGEILTPETQLAFIGLGTISLIPILYKVYRRRQGKALSEGE